MYEKCEEIFPKIIGNLLCFPCIYISKISLEFYLFLLIFFCITVITIIISSIILVLGYRSTSVIRENAAFALFLQNCT